MELLWAALVLLLGVDLASAQDVTTVAPTSNSSSGDECLLSAGALSSHEPGTAELSQLLLQLSSTPAPLPAEAQRQLQRLAPGLRQLTAMLASSTSTPSAANATTRRLRAPPGAMAFERELAAQHLAEIRADLNWTALEAPCRRAVTALLDGVDGMEDWAWEMFDSNGKPEAGFSDGNSFWEGRFSQCNGVHHETEAANESSVHIQGRYYKAQLTGLLMPDQQSFRVTVGTCFPDLCSDAEVRAILNDAPGFMSLPKVPAGADGVTFRTDDVTGVLTERQFWRDYTAVSALATVLLFSGLAVVGTIVDLLDEDASKPAPAPRREDTTTAAAGASDEQTKLVASRPSGYSALETGEAPTSATSRQ